MSNFTHFNEQGEAHMVNVGNKTASQRRAIAKGCIHMHTATLQMILSGNHKKGDVLGIARIAGIMAAKKTSDLIPLCHTLMLSSVEIDFTPDTDTQKVHCTACVETWGRTGVEMEALTAVQIALLTIYDMCKAVDRAMSIHQVRLIEKLGGKSGHWKQD